jgi:hypothetical protein
MNQTQSGEQLDSEFLYFLFLLPLMNDNENRKEGAVA